MAEIGAIVGNGLAQALKLRREALNNKYRLAKQTYRALDDAAFAAFLHTTLDPIATAVAGRHPDRLPDVVEALYDLSLPLVAQRWLGPASRAPALEPAWRKLLIGLSHWLAPAPAKLAGALLNALYKLNDLGEPALQAWADDVLRIAPHCDDLDQMLAAGRLLAWRHGLTTLRGTAIEAGLALPAHVAQSALSLPQPLTVADWQRMQTEPQTMPIDCIDPPGKAPIWLGWVGGFAGFGGQFLRPPSVMGNARGLYATDGRQAWIIVADGYGAQLLPARDVEPWPANLHPGLKINAPGLVSVGQSAAGADLVPAARQAAWHAGLLAVASDATHRIALIRWESPQR